MVHFAIVYSKIVFVDKETSGPVLMLQLRPRPKKEKFCCQKRKQVKKIPGDVPASLALF